MRNKVLRSVLILAVLAPSALAGFVVSAYADPGCGTGDDTDFFEIDNTEVITGSVSVHLSGTCGSVSVVEIHPCSGIADFGEVDTNGANVGPIKAVKSGGTTYSISPSVTINGSHVPFGNGMNTYGGIHVPGMGLVCSGVSSHETFILVCEDDTEAVNFNYHGKPYEVCGSSAYEKEPGVWEATPKTIPNQYGTPTPSATQEYATPGKQTPTAVVLSNFFAKSSANNSTFWPLVGILCTTALIAFGLYRRRR